jgi:hypothetical protein
MSKQKVSLALRKGKIEQSTSASPVASSLYLFSPTTLVGFAHTLSVAFLRKFFKKEVDFLMSFNIYY